MRPELANAMRREVGRDDRPRRAARNAGRLSAKSKFRGSRKTAEVDTSELLFFTDPGHGWLRVPLDSCKGLGISNYSYMDASKGYAYLEQDSDAPKWLKAHGISEMFANTIGWRAAQDESFVRNLPSFSESAIAATARRRTAGNKGRRRSTAGRRKFAAADVDDWIDAVRNAIEEYEMDGNYVPGNLTEDDMRNWAENAIAYAEGDYDTDDMMDSERTAAAYDYLDYEGVFDNWGEGMESEARRRTAGNKGRRRRTAAMRGSGVDPYDGVDYGEDSLSDFLSDNPDFSGLEVVKEVRSGDELYVEFSNGWGYEGQLIETPDYDRIDISIFRPDSRGGASYWDSAVDEDDAIALIKGETGVGRTARRRKVAYRTIYDGPNLRVEMTDQNAMYVISYDAGDEWVEEKPIMAETLAEAIYGIVSLYDGDFAEPELQGTLPAATIREMWKLYEDIDAKLSESGYYAEYEASRKRASRNNHRNARKEATVNPNRRRTPARRTVARRTVARRSPAGAPARRPGRRPVTATRRPAAPRPVAGRRVAGRRPVVGRTPVRRPLAARRPVLARRPAARPTTRTAGFARGTVVTLKREAARSRTPLTLRVVATRNGKFVGERLAGRRPTGELWEFTSREVARVAARTPQRRIAPPLARRRRYADQSTSTDFPGMAAPAPSAPAGETPTFDDANLMSPTADADGTEADWMDDPTVPLTGAGDVSTTSPTATEYSGTPDELEAPVAGTDADITVDGEVVGLIAEDTGSSTVIPGDATEVTAGRRTEARFFAAQRLAQLRVEAGVMQGDPVVIGHQLVASKMSLNEMQSEIGTLDRVITVRGSVDDDAPRKVAKERKGGLVPRSSGRTVPSMVSAPSAPAVDGDDFALFE